MTLNDWTTILNQGTGIDDSLYGFADWLEEQQDLRADAVRWMIRHGKYPGREPMSSPHPWYWQEVLFRGKYPHLPAGHSSLPAAVWRALGSQYVFSYGCYYSTRAEAIFAALSALLDCHAGVP